jgi:glycosyltransferase involved in cell wall biosynthesis
MSVKLLRLFSRILCPWTEPHFLDLRADPIRDAFLEGQAMETGDKQPRATWRDPPSHVKIPGRSLRLGPMAKAWRLFKWIIRNALPGPVGRFLLPGLGNLSPCPPRDLVVPARYYQTPVPSPAPRISIVTPSLNQALFLEFTLRSVIEQNYPDIEYMVQDGGSSDGSVEILKRYERLLTRWESLQDRGQAHAINLGFAHATGEIMAWLNSDDLLLPGTLNYVADFFNQHPDVDVIYGHRILIDEMGREIGRWILPPHDEEAIRWADYVPQETLFWRRRIWKVIGGAVDEDFEFAMDWELILRFQEARAKFVRLPRFLGAFRVWPDQKTQKAMEKQGALEMAILLERYHGRLVSQAEAALQTRGYLARHVFQRILYDLGLSRY